jgi:hypothetical protein
VPHCGALHEAVQVTPLPDRSLFTVAVNETGPPAATDVEPAETETMIGGTTIVRELPPQPAMIVTEANPRSEMANRAVCFICPSASAISAMAAATCPSSSEGEPMHESAVAGARCTEFFSSVRTS